MVPAPHPYETAPPEALRTRLASVPPQEPRALGAVGEEQATVSARRQRPAVRVFSERVPEFFMRLRYASARSSGRALRAGTRRQPLGLRPVGRKAQRGTAAAGRGGYRGEGPGTSSDSPIPPPPRCRRTRGRPGPVPVAGVRITPGPLRCPLSRPDGREPASTRRVQTLSNFLPRLTQRPVRLDIAVQIIQSAIELCGLSRRERNILRMLAETGPDLLE